MPLEARFAEWARRYPADADGRQSLGRERARRLVEGWLANEDARVLLRVNRWEGVEWFGGEWEFKT